MVQETSMKSYDEIQIELGEKQRQVLTAFEKHGPHTDMEMVHILNLKDANQLRPRRFELVEQGLIQEVDKRECQISGKTAIVWGVVENPENIRRADLKCLTENDFIKISKMVAAANKYQLQKIIEHCSDRLKDME